MNKSPIKLPVILEQESVMTLKSLSSKKVTTSAALMKILESPINLTVINNLDFEIQILNEVEAIAGVGL
ncbi:MAG: hypothetical protein ACI9LE_001410 [Paraglaciecola sp.]